MLQATWRLWRLVAGITTNVASTSPPWSLGVLLAQGVSTAPYPPRRMCQPRGVNLLHQPSQVIESSGSHWCDRGPQDVGPPELEGPTKTLPKPRRQIGLDHGEAGESLSHPQQVLLCHHQGRQTLLLHVKLLEGLGVGIEATQLEGVLSGTALPAEEEGAAMPVLGQKLGALRRRHLGHGQGKDAAAQIGRMEETLQTEVVIHLVLVLGGGRGDDRGGLGGRGKGDERV